MHLISEKSGTDNRQHTSSNYSTTHLFHFPEKKSLMTCNKTVPPIISATNFLKKKSMQKTDILLNSIKILQKHWTIKRVNSRELFIDPEGKPSLQSLHDSFLCHEHPNR